MAATSGLRAALIGCGGMGRGHARNAQQLGIEVVGYCDIVEAAAVRACEEFGGQYATTDAGRIMRDDRIDLLFIATHHDGHHPLALAGAQAGKHMLLEKPMCLTWEQAMEVAAAVERAGVKMVINHKFRISPATQKTRELLPRPRVSHGHLAMTDSSRGRSAWLWRPDDGGGLTLSTASHTVDLLYYLMASRAERVYAEGRRFAPAGKGDTGYPDGLAGTIAWQSGAISTVISTDQGQNPYSSKFFVQLADGERSAVLHAHITGEAANRYLQRRAARFAQEARVGARITRVHALFLRAIFAWQRRAARDRGIVGGAQSGAVTFIQRFGGQLNLNVHFLDARGEHRTYGS